MNANIKRRPFLLTLVAAVAAIAALFGMSAHAQATPVWPVSPTVYVYLDEVDNQLQQELYASALDLMAERGAAWEERTADNATIAGLAGINGKVRTPRFFAGDPAADGWKGEPKVNNGGLRWLTNELPTAPPPPAEAEELPAPSEPVLISQRQTVAVASSVTNSPAETDVIEGNPASFTLRREGDTDSPLTVNLSVTETGDMVVANTGQQTVTFLAGEDTATFDAPTVDDGADEPDSTVTVTVESGVDYDPGEPSSAQVLVRDNDLPTVSPATLNCA